MVRHRDDDAVALSGPPDLRGPTPVHGDVLEDRVERGLRRDRIGHGPERAVAASHLEAQPVGLPAAAHRRPAQLGNVGGTAVEPEGTAVGPGHLQEALGHAAQIVDLAEGLAPQLRVAFGHDLDGLAEIRQGRSKLVGRVGGEAGLGLVGAADRPHGSPGQPPSGQEARDDGEHAPREEQQADLVDQVRLLGQGASRHHQRDGPSVHPHGNGHQPDRLAGRPQVGHLGGLRAEPGRQRVLVPDGLPVRLEQGYADRGAGGHVGVGGGLEAAGLADVVRLLGRGVPQRRGHVVVQAPGQQGLPDPAQHDQDDGEHQAVGYGHPEAERPEHQRPTAYPTPRTVSMRSGAPALSSFRLR